jgi:hypothetical protein
MNKIIYLKIKTLEENIERKKHEKIKEILPERNIFLKILSFFSKKS